MTLIGLVGKKRAGKDTCASYFVKEHGYVQMAYAEPVKEICRVAFGFNDNQLYGEEKEEEDEMWGIPPRKAFQFIGTDVFRDKISEILPNSENNFWVHLMKKRILSSNNKNIVISDVRFQNETDLIKELGGIIIKVERPTLTSNDMHASEQNIDNITGIDFTIVNDKTMEELNTRLRDILFLQNI